MAVWLTQVREDGTYTITLDELASIETDVMTALRTSLSGFGYTSGELAHMDAFIEALTALV